MIAGAAAKRRIQSSSLKVVDARVRQVVEDSSFDPVHPPAPAAPAERWWGDHLGELRWQLELARLLVDPVYRGEASRAATARPWC